MSPATSAFRTSLFEAPEARERYLNDAAFHMQIQVTGQLLDTAGEVAGTDTARKLAVAFADRMKDGLAEQKRHRDLVEQALRGLLGRGVHVLHPSLDQRLGRLG